ncbi:Arc family DNA-binding protein [Stenotrophomonas sp. 278]|uniref:Arc family DNA-binding protein n=1 Tax=Stenotrophomonas sp. 278 TaxID=2479851 RepID=UPI0016398129|nr:Arc family DNA-binding protein [Stenotrophomonas sp. 278]
MEKAHVVVRMPVDLRDWIKEKAAADRRSVNFMTLELLERAKAEDEQRKHVGYSSAGLLGGHGGEPGETGHQEAA